MAESTRSQPRTHSPWLMYGFGFLVGCTLAQVGRYVEAPATALEQVTVHTSVVALMLLVWSVCHAYARLWTLRQQPPTATS